MGSDNLGLFLESEPQMQQFEANNSAGISRLASILLQIFFYSIFFAKISCAETIEIKARIPVELHERFVRALPVYGALAWTMRTVLDEFCTSLEASDSLREHVLNSIKAATR